VSATSPLSGLELLRDPSGIREAFQTASEQLTTDPAAVVGAAKDLVEATAKTVLVELGSPANAKTDIGPLAKEVQERLGLRAGGADSPDSSDAVKKVLGSLTGIVIGITELRNVAGRGHGRATASNLGTRHARLMLNAARTWCEIVLDTYLDLDAPWKKR